MFNTKKTLALLLALACSLTLASCGSAQEEAPAEEPAAETETADAPVIGITWAYTDTEDPDVIAEYEGYAAVIEEAGGVAVNLAQVTTTSVGYDENGVILPEYVDENGMLLQEYADLVKACDYASTNVEEVMDGIDGVFFIGGEDISPSLYAEPVALANNGEEINATRDISDYTLMAYCIDNDIPTLAACRGEQMMGIVSGCTFIQDLPDYYEAQGVEGYEEVYDGGHRMAPGMENRTYARHAVDILDNSKWLGDIVGADTLENVSSWHHQNVGSVEGTNLTVVATATLNDVTLVEAIERQDKTFCLGVQFHPENDCALALYEGDTEAALCDLDTCLNFFRTLVSYAAQ